MGKLVDGTWHDVWYPTKEHGGRFVRQDAAFRDAVSDAADARFPVEAGRYNLYVSWACPWAHRVVLYRALKGLQDAIPLHVVSPLMLSKGWVFDDDHVDGLYGLTHLHALYTRANATFTGRVTVPVLWDTVEGTIVNNESSELIRQLDGPFARLGDPGAPLAGVSMTPADLLPEIDRINAFVYDRVNNGVYRAGFATTQEAYDEAVTALFDALDSLDARLAGQPWLAGDRVTEADWRLFTTAVRFDAVYHQHFKCTRRRWVDHPHLLDHTRALFQFPGVAETVQRDEIRAHYFRSHPSINPHGIVPVCPDLSLDVPHARGSYGLG